MTDDTQPRGKQPDFTAWFAPDRKAPWTRIGAAWMHEDGEGFNLRLDLIPNAPGGIVLRRPKSETEAGS